MKSLAFTKAEQKERNSPSKLACSPYEGEKYPWGMRLDLNSDVMKKLDLDTLPKAGAEVMIKAKAKVVSTSINDRDGKQEKRMELQIVAMDLDVPAGEMEDEIFKDMPEA